MSDRSRGVSRPEKGKTKVRHIRTGHRGIWHGTDGTTEFQWVLVEWHYDEHRGPGPGMCREGLSRVARSNLEIIG